MISEPEFNNLIHSIVIKHLPDEEFLFDVEGPGIISELYAGKSVHHTAVGAEFHIMDPNAAKQIVEYITVINTTFGLINSVINFLKSTRPTQMNVSQIAERFTKALVAAGIKTNKAKAIADSLVEDLVRMENN